MFCPMCWANTRSCRALQPTPMRLSVSTVRMEAQCAFVAIRVVVYLSGRWTPPQHSEPLVILFRTQHISSPYLRSIEKHHADRTGYSIHQGWSSQLPTPHILALRVKPYLPPSNGRSYDTLTTT